MVSTIHTKPDWSLWKPLQFNDSITIFRWWLKSNKNFHIYFSWRNKIVLYFPFPWRYFGEILKMKNYLKNYENIFLLALSFAFFNFVIANMKLFFTANETIGTIFVMLFVLFKMFSLQLWIICFWLLLPKLNLTKFSQQIFVIISELKVSFPSLIFASWEGKFLQTQKLIIFNNTFSITSISFSIFHPVFDWKWQFDEKNLRTNIFIKKC